LDLEVYWIRDNGLGKLAREGQTKRELAHEAEGAERARGSC